MNDTLENSIISNLKIKEIVAELYEIGEIIEVDLIRNSFNDNYLLTTEKNKFILRVHLNNKYYINSKMDFIFELEYLTFLKSGGFSVALPLRNKNGKLLSVCEVNNERRYMVLFSYIDGEHTKRSLNASKAIKFGGKIADLHLISNDFNSCYSRYYLDLKFLLEEPVKFIKDKNYDLSFLEPNINKVKKFIFSIDKNVNTFGLIHGDLNPSNVIVSDEMTFIDFDHCGYGYRIHDLVVPKLCFEKETFKYILQGYQSNRKLEETEVEAINIYEILLNLRKIKDLVMIHKVTNKRMENNISEENLIKKGLDLLKKQCN